MWKRVRKGTLFICLLMIVLASVAAMRRVQGGTKRRGSVRPRLTLTRSCRDTSRWLPWRICMPRNPRSSNGALRRKHRARFRAMNAPCGICRGKLGPIDYTAPSDSAHPLSFVIDEVRPVSRWREYGYDSPEAAAQDWNNLQAAHYICNQKKAARVPEDRQRMTRLLSLSDGEW